MASTITTSEHYSNWKLLQICGSSALHLPVSLYQLNLLAIIPGNQANLNICPILYWHLKVYKLKVVCITR